MKTLLFNLSASILNSSIASAATIHKVDVAGYLASFSTSLGSSDKRVFSPLGMQLTYNYRPDMSLSGFGNYSMLSSGKGILLQGISGGVNYAIWGGQTQTHIFTNNTVFLYSFPIRIGIYAGATLRSYDFNSLNTSARRFSLLQTVPDTGLLLGIEPGINIEGVVFGRFYYTAQTAYVLPYFISNSKQSGRIISLSAGFGASL